MSIDKEQLLAYLTQLDSGDQLDELDLGYRPRGMPERSAIESLADTYLQEQAEHWPELVGTALLPSRSAKHLSGMAEQFERQYLSKTPPAASIKLSDGVTIGAAYARYSDANSNPRSLNQQLSNVLRGAATKRVFIPWDHVFADAAITGTTEHRRGYQLLKRLIAGMEASLSAVFIDELGRASRDQLESLTLGRLIESSGSRLIGVTDGFDSANAMSKMMLSIFSMVHELYVDQLREKVERGMNDAFKQGRPLYQPGFGYRLVPILGEDGQVIQSSNGKIVKQVVIDEEDAIQVRRVFTLYTVDKLSPQKIARLYNKERIGGKDSWTNSQIQKTLRRAIYHGQEPWGRTTNVMDPATGKLKPKDLPEDQWQWREMPHLRIVDEDLWEAAQARLEECSQAYDSNVKAMSRGEAHPKRLFHLVCGHCGGQMWCTRGGDRQVVRCNSGRDGVGGCTATASKTLKQIEESLLNHVLERYFSEQFVDEVFAAANAELLAIAEEPAIDVEPLRQQLSKKEKTRDRLLRKLENADDETHLDRIFEVVTKLEAEIAELQQEVKRSTIGDADLPPIQREVLVMLISTLRELLYEDVALAGSILGSLTGQVKLTQVEVPGKKRPQWNAEFTFDHAKMFVEIARQRNCPSTDTWEFLCSRSWTIGGIEAVTIRSFSNAERVAKTVAEMLSAGTSRNAVAIAVGSDVETVDKAMRLWEVGTWCYLPPKDFSVRRQQPGSSVEKIGQEVVRLIDQQKMSVRAIAEQLGVSQALVSRAYKRSKQAETAALAAVGKTLSIPQALRLPPQVHARIRELLLAGGMSYRAIAREVRCNHHAVADAHKRMQREQAA